jgi:hypothetical protein
MEFEFSRLRRGELIAGVSGIVLLASLLLVPWYGSSAAASALGGSSSASGWSTLSVLRWLILIDALTAVALALSQAARRAPAIPVSLSVISTALGALTVLAMIYRVLIHLPGPDNLIDQRFGAVVGLLAAIALLCGAFTSLRQEGIAPGDAAAVVTVTPGAPDES